MEITKEGKVFVNNKEKKQSTHTCGYKVIWYNNKTNYVHRLVAEKYIPNPNNLPCVNHINGIKDDNRLENLEWSTKRKNCEHARLNGLSELKSRNIRDLTYEEYLKICDLRKNGVSYRKIGLIMNLDYRRVRDTFLGLRYKDFKKRKEVSLV